MVNKKAWIRIMEATIAILIVGSTLLIIYTKQLPHETNKDYIYNTQQKILMDINSNNELREAVLKQDDKKLNNFVKNLMPKELGFSLRICEIDKPCKLDPKTFKKTIDKEIYTKETIISANLQKYNPKKVKLFVWEE